MANKVVKAQQSGETAPAPASPPAGGPCQKCKGTGKVIYVESQRKIKSVMACPDCVGKVS